MENRKGVVISQLSKIQNRKKILLDVDDFKRREYQMKNQELAESRRGRKGGRRRGGGRRLQC